MDTITLVRYLERNVFDWYGRESETADLTVAVLMQAGRDYEAAA